MGTIENLRVGDRIADKYVVERVLGQGGMGIVVAARHVDLDQSVAIKFILPEALRQPGIVERLLREARASAKLRSEHVARVTDVGRTSEGTPFLVMELLAGTDLANLLETRGPLPSSEAALYVAQACEAIGEAHAAGIIHRDIKPANLFVTTRRDGSPCVKVLDFGIAKEENLAAASMTSTGSVLGTPLYMSPEQVRSSKTATPSTDLWALGVTLYELTTGNIPYDVTTVTELIAKILTEPPIPARQRNPAVSPEMEAVIMRCLQIDPAARFGSAGELRAALLALAKLGDTGFDGLQTITLGGGPVAAQTPPPFTGSSAASSMGGASVALPARDPRLASPRTESGTTSNVSPPATGGRGAVMVVAGVALLGVLGGGAAFYLTRAPSPASSASPAVSAEAPAALPATSGALDAPEPGPSIAPSPTASVATEPPAPAASAAPALPPAAPESAAPAANAAPPTAKRPPARPPEKPKPPATGAPASPGTSKPGWGGML